MKKNFKETLKNKLDQIVTINYIRKNDVRHSLTGKVIVILNDKIIFLQDDDLTVNISFSNILAISEPIKN